MEMSERGGRGGEREMKKRKGKGKDKEEKEAMVLDTGSIFDPWYMNKVQ